MKTISYKLKDLDQKEKKVTLKLGYVGENEHVQIRIDCSEIWENYPNAVASLAVEPPEGSKYPAIVTRDGDVVCWTVKDSDLVNDGYGRIQLTFTEGSEIQKTVICRTKVDESIVGSGTAPDPIADFVSEANEALAELEAAEVHGPVIGEDGYWYTWSKDAGEYVKTDTKAQGEDGQQGPAGKDGADGAPGQDGHTPVKGTDYWTQQDQADIVAAAALETVSAVIDDTAGDGDTNKTWSADKIAETTGQLLSGIEGVSKIIDINNATEIEYTVLRNLYDRTQIEKGGSYDTDGTWHSESSYASSALIDVRDVNSVTYENRNTTNMALKFVYYDNNGDYINGESNYKNSSDPKIVVIDTTNIGYIRFSTKDIEYNKNNVFLFAQKTIKCVLNNNILYVNEKSADVTSLLNSAFANSNILKVSLGVGEYFVSDTIDIKNGKSLLMSGCVGMYVTDADEVDTSVLSVIRPRNLAGYIFYLGTLTTVEGGFINCSFMATGGCFYIDGAWSKKEGITINTNMYGNYNFDLIAVYINGDRLTSGYNGGHVTNINMNCRISGYGCGLYVERHDTDTTSNKFCWMTDINVHGYMNRCQRYIYYDVDSDLHAGGGSVIDCVIQGGVVPDSSIPAIDVMGDTMILNALFHDISFESYAPQKVRYNFHGNKFSTVLSVGLRRGSQNIIGNYESVKFLLDRQYHEITEIEEYDNNEIRETSYWNRVENIIKVYLRARLCTTSTWTKLMTLPFEARTMKRFSAVNDNGVRLLFYVSGADLMYQSSETGNCSLNFDYILKETASTGIDV